MTGQEKDNLRRHSVAGQPDLIIDPAARAEAEARNGLKQFDLGLRIIEDALAKGVDFRWRPSTILALHREALSGISEFAGNWRPASVGIEGSVHEPVGAHLVPEYVEELCDYLKDHKYDRTPIHLSAYAMWRLNWIHPFSDGNGRTSRIFSYVVLCVSLGFALRGSNTIPDQIVANRRPYFDALEKADAACKGGRVDVSEMESLLKRLLAVQLTSVFDRATGENSL
ncbi:Fic family protein [Methylocystis sp. 9N]|uniref:Fic family protein n=1 Tax=Methylocystis borbori TaxID=3118750 RepID=A0ABU7XJ39_9HYPH